jgi:hypothetical protein
VILILIVRLAKAALPEGDRPFAAKVTKRSCNDGGPRFTNEEMFRMDEQEMRAKLAALEAQNASLKEQKELRDKIAALEAEDAALAADLADEPIAEQTAVTQAAPAAPAAQDAEDATKVVMVRKGSRLRNILVGVLVLLSCLVVAVTGIAWWAHYTVLNTDGYMKIVGPVGKDPEAIASLSDYIAGQIVSATDLQQRTTDALPPKAQIFAGPITGALEDFIAKGTSKVLSTPQAYDLWLNINEVAHEKIVALLRGDTTYAYIEGSDVKLDTLPLISQALVWLDGKLPGALGEKFSPPVIAPGTPPEEAIQQVSTWTGRTLPADFGQITLLQSDSLGPAQTAVRWFDTLVWVLLAVTIVLIAITIWLSRRRRRTIIELGIGAAFALILTHVIAVRASAALIDSIASGGTVTVLRDVVNASLAPLTNITIWIVVIGLLVAVGAWLAGRHDVRVAVVTAGKRVARAPEDEAVTESPITLWVERYAHWLRIAGLVAGVILLLFATSSWLGILLWVVVILLFEGVISFLIGEWPFGRGEKGEETPA